MFTFFYVVWWDVFVLQCAQGVVFHVEKSFFAACRRGFHWPPYMRSDPLLGYVLLQKQRGLIIVVVD